MEEWRLKMAGTVPVLPVRLQVSVKQIRTGIFLSTDSVFQRFTSVRIIKVSTASQFYWQNHAKAKGFLNFLLLLFLFYGARTIFTHIVGTDTGTVTVSKK
jgi:hypothetical protein